MVPVPKDSITLSESQMAILANPLRSRMVLALRTGGACSMSELALRLEVDPKILYYPLKKLTDAGLVWLTGSTKSNRRIEGMYGLVAYRMELPKSAALETRKKLMRTTIRCAEQDAMNAQEASIVDPKVTDAMNVFRAPLWLSEDDRKELFQELSSLVEKYSVRSIRQKNDLLMWTSLIVPVPRRN